MTQGTVYIIEPKSNDLRQMVDLRNRMGRSVTRLAAQTGEQVWFHSYKQEMIGGAPVLMLECSEKFLTEVKKLPEYGHSWEAPQQGILETKRDEAIQKVFNVKPDPFSGPKPGM